MAYCLLHFTFCCCDAGFASDLHVFFPGQRTSGLVECISVMSVVSYGASFGCFTPPDVRRQSAGAHHRTRSVRPVDFPGSTPTGNCSARDHTTRRSPTEGAGVL